jgi:hypothetical protein
VGVAPLARIVLDVALSMYCVITIDTLSLPEAAARASEASEAAVPYVLAV